MTPDRVEVLWRASGLKRSGLVAQFSWPRYATKFALGLENPLAHALVDRLLGYNRAEEESRLQLTPVEWGILTFVVARSLQELATEPGVLGDWDIVIDRVGPDPFDPSDVGALVTLRWPVRLGSLASSARLWVPEALVAQWLDGPEPRLADDLNLASDRFGTLSTQWCAEAGVLILPRGLARFRAGAILPLTDSPLRGTPQNLAGAVALAASFSDRGERCWFPAEPLPLSGGGRLRLTAPLQRELKPREAIAVNPSSESAPSPGVGGVAPAEVPVTLVVELGRVNLSLSRLADLKPGDVIELGRHSRAPVELTSGGRLVARGELVQIDTELGVRLTHVFL
ncbi:MAG: FliM/FliN family flagellar motor switch protein [Isosphaeraceae bacterium]|nr:FliM/FliN family flagellar motor switch protein [Isosphaeraceae bacterium]